MSSQTLTCDLHIHSEFSPDSTTPLEAYASLANQLSFHVGFLDHFELAFLDRPEYLTYEGLPKLLEAYDKVHTNYPQTSIGLEVDYYTDLESKVAEFCDDYRKDFDYLIGVVHTVERLAVTTLEGMDTLVTRFGLQEILERYFYEVEGAIRSELFAGIAHIDGVMRFLPQYSTSPELEALWHNRTLELGLLCKKLGLVIEVNLRGLHHPWGQIHPGPRIIDILIDEGAKFYVGSDSHSLQDFQNAVMRLTQMHNFLINHNSFAFPEHL